MAIIKANILTFVNRALRRAETDIDIDIQTTLNDLSNLDLLEAEDNTQTLSSGDTTLAYPTDFRGLVSIVLIDSSSVRRRPLTALPGGQSEYEDLRRQDAATSTPWSYAEFNKLFHLWRPPDQNFTTEIKYYRRHPQDLDNILFGDEFTNAVNFGAAYETATSLGLTRLINIWERRYLAEKTARINDAPAVPRITGSIY